MIFVDIQSFLSMPIEKFKIMPAAKLKALHDLELFCLEDILYHFPKRYEDRRLKNIDVDFNGDIAGKSVALPLKIVTVPKVNFAGPFHLIKFSAVELDANDFEKATSNYVEVTFFNCPFLSSTFKVNGVHAFYGKYNQTLTSFEITNPKTFSVKNEVSPFYPVYRKKKALNQLDFSRMVKAVLKELKKYEDEMDIIPVEIAAKYGLCGRYKALCDIHTPSDEGIAKEAKRRLIFDELFIYTLAVSMMKNRRVKKQAPILSPKVTMEEFYSALPFKLTNAQQKAIHEVCFDLAKPNPMSRLVQGDVGSGKTMIAAAAAFFVCSNGKQACLMAPTEILAVQHYNELSALFEKFGIQTALITSSVKGKKRQSVLEGLASGETGFIVGTHAVIEKEIVFKELALTITDEQHRFGVMQRSRLDDKNILPPHTLVMSATPIPRTLSLIMYGDLDISVLNELPPGRQKVDTFAVDENFRVRIDNFIRKLVGEGGQIFIVCPLVAEDEDEDMPPPPSGFTPRDFAPSADASVPEENKANLKSVEAYYKELSEVKFPDIKIGFIHGKMKAKEKDSVMSEFQSGEIKILVSTVVIEVGVNIPNAVCMIIENAERFGLSQLHQLRGRVGRGKKKSYCILFCDNKTENAKKRLDIMCRTNDGFEIARKDIEIRGPGDFFGTKQSGELDFRIANLSTDMEILVEAADAAKKIATLDKNLDREENRKMKSAVEMFMKSRSDGNIVYN